MRPVLQLRPVLFVALLLGLAACRDDDAPRRCLASEAMPASREGVVCGVVDAYDIALDLTSLRATVDVTLRPAEADEPCAMLHSEPRPIAGAWNGFPIRVDRGDDGRVRACGPIPSGAVVVSSDVELEVDPNVVNGIGITRSVDRFGNSFTYLLGWIERCDRFGPCDRSIAALSDFAFAIDHAPETTVLCPGIRVVEGGSTRCSFPIGARAPTYSSYGVLASDALVGTLWTTAGSIVVERYEVGEGVTGATIDPGEIGSYLAFVTSLLGPLPYGDTLRVAFAPTRFLGFEHPANVVLSDTAHEATTLYTNPARHTLFHEIAHQWAGNRTTLRAKRDFLWKEAIAEYLAYVFQDALEPDGELVTRESWDSSARFAPVYPVPLDSPEPPFEQVTYVSYSVGPMLLLALEDLLGRAVVLEGIRQFLEPSAARTTRELLDTIEGVAGVDLDGFANAYVYGVGEPDWPAYAITTSVDGSDVVVTATQHVRAGGPRPAVIEVLLRGATTTARARVDYGLAPSSFTATVRVAFPEPVTSVVVDPDHRALDAPMGSTTLPSDPAARRPLHP